MIMDKTASERGFRTAADYLTASKQCEIRNLQSLLSLCELVVACGNLVHALQRERGASNLFLGSGGNRFGQEIARIREQTDIERGAFQDTLNAADGHLEHLADGTRMFNGLAYAVHALSELDVLRAKVSALQLDAVLVTQAYSAVIQALLLIVFETADIAADPEIARALVAMFNLMQGKELAGQERAAGSAGFASQRFDSERSALLVHLIEAQERCFEIFLQFADEQSSARWATLQQAPELLEIERMRRSATAPAGSVTRGPELADRWFALMTSRIDAMKQVEDALEHYLSQLCIDRLAQARTCLHQNQLALGSLGSHAGFSSEPFVLVRAKPLLNDGSDVTVAGKSMMDLLQYQSQRLQQINNELAEARAALEERKLLERAKVLLMTHRKMSEEEAHKLLRNMAMNQSRRLIDVARSVIDMAAVWQGQ
ncbi:nitrate regulatory protein [Pseudohongiella sp.]|uniref:ANTAR domain-containing protein n=1 Tax=marine sediment metagenome TaxID=412755 RepID=A0A0F9W6H5_9ZZZZ|nr:nitrate regulatory protein [Pseudohongiella sp.]HDZ09486.1 ANTAR domain-containing protein [Pseudohongiella sp.]HEA63942.1 ANTAR domain-containing protein [Pseudohongiella sp.]